MNTSQNWRWLLEPGESVLRIILDQQREHLCPYKATRLVPLSPLNAGFSIADAEAFEAFSESLGTTQSLSAEVIFKASLNYLIISHFGRPQQPQSWYFQQATQAIDYKLKLASLIELNSGLATAIFAIISNSNDVSEIMLLDQKMPLSDIKTLQQFEVIKVLNNRLRPALAELENNLCSSAKRFA